MENFGGKPNSSKNLETIRRQMLPHQDEGSEMGGINNFAKIINKMSEEEKELLRYLATMEEATVSTISDFSKVNISIVQRVIQSLGLQPKIIESKQYFELRKEQKTWVVENLPLDEKKITEGIIDALTGGLFDEE